MEWQLSSFWKYTFLLFSNLLLAHLDVSKHFRKVVSLGAQVEMVENVLLHAVQVGIFHLDLLSGEEVNREASAQNSQQIYLIKLKFLKYLLDALVAHTVE